ncbi:MAG: LysR family transcriptional regulator [Nannocystaceae bacterium]|nr:LysR family transcriptional regulator [Nannocystaceae bacterium]
MGVDSIEELRVFIQVADSGGLSAAARALGVAPNQVSRKLAKLERRLGVQLVRHTTRQLSVSEEGLRFAVHARAVLDRLALAEEELQLARGELRGTVRLQVSSLMLQADLMADLRELLAAHPKLHVEVLIEDAPVALLARRCDVGLHVGRPPDSTLIARRLGSVTPLLAAATRYLDRAGRPEEPSDLAHHSCLVFSGKAPSRRWLLHAGDSPPTSVTVGGQMASNDSRALFDALCEGVGIGLISRRALQRGLASSALERVLPRWSCAPFELFALTPPGPRRAPPVKAMVEILRRAVARLDS